MPAGPDPTTGQPDGAAGEQGDTDPLTDLIRGALINVLMNTSNYPPAAQARMLGKDFTGLLNRATDAVVNSLTASGIGVAR